MEQDCTALPYLCSHRVASWPQQPVPGKSKSSQRSLQQTAGSLSTALCTHSGEASSRPPCKARWLSTYLLFKSLIYMTFQQMRSSKLDDRALGEKGMLMTEASAGELSSDTGMCVLSHFSRVWLFVTLWTTDPQAPLSMGFSRQEHWSGVPCPPCEGDLPDPGMEPVSLKSPALEVGSLSPAPPGKPKRGGVNSSAFDDPRQPSGIQRETSHPQWTTWFSGPSVKWKQQASCPKIIKKFQTVPTEHETTLSIFLNMSPRGAMIPELPVSACSM